MKLSIGIVGLPNVGKSTLFKLLTKQEVNIANYPFATIDPNVGIVPVPDGRLPTLAKLSGSKKIVPAVVEFYDIAGLVKGANKGEGLGNQFLSHIRECSAICMVLRCFGKSDIIHIEGSVDALRDMEIVETELALKDFETVEKRLGGLSRDLRSGNKETKREEEALREAYRMLDSGKPFFQYFDIRHTVRESILGMSDVLGSLNLLTLKPQIFLLNGTEEDIPEDLRLRIKELGVGSVVCDLDNEALRRGSEQVLRPFDTAQGGQAPADAKALAGEQHELGDTQFRAPELITKAYEVLGLISFLTTGEDETRAWTIKKGTKAPQAAGVIHTDFEKKFIKAEVVSYNDFVECGGWSGARERGKLRLEGREYEVLDGDVVVVKHG